MVTIVADRVGSARLRSIARTPGGHRVSDPRGTAGMMASGEAEGEVVESWRARRKAKREQRDKDEELLAELQAFGRTPMSVQEIDAALNLNSPGIVEEVHALAVRMLQGEEARESRMEGKAQSLLSTAGLSLTAASTFGVFVLQQSKLVLAPLGRWAIRGIGFCYAAALICGLLAACQAARALYITGRYRTINEQKVFAALALETADKQGPGPAAQREYRRYLAVHYWRIWQRNFIVHQQKADLIKGGQKLFLIFLLCVIVVGAAFAASAFATVW